MAQMTADKFPPGTAPEPAIVLDFWSDVVCPWCYLTKHRVRTAIDAWERPHEVLVRHRAYELDPGTPRGRRLPVEAADLARRAGGEEGDTAVTDRVTALAAAEGLFLDFSNAVRANTFDAHRLVALGAAAGGPAQADAIVERLFSAHFTEGLAIDDHSVLLRCSAEAGLDERRVAAVLADDTYGDEVRADEQEAERLGVRSVPFVLGNGRLAITGAQPVDALTELLRAALAPA